MRIHPVGSVLTAATLVLTPLAVGSVASAAEVPDAPASAGYLATQLAAGDDRLTVEAGGQTYDDLGLTIDAILAIQATRTAGTQAGASTDYVLANAGSYTGAGTGDLYAGAAGKLLTLLASRSLPTTVGGTDYLAALVAQEQDSGQFTDKSAYGDYSNSLSQSFALIGLKRNGTNPSTAAVDFLLDQQCSDGGFSLNYGEGCSSDPDATSIAVQALSAVGGQGAAVDRAADYLQTKQGADGGVAGGTTTEGANANSTGLAAVAFRIAGRDAALTQARTFIHELTFDCTYAELAGGIAYDPAAFTGAAKDAAATDQVNRTTAQALLGLTDLSYVDVTSAGSRSEVVLAECEEPTEPTSEPTTPTSDPTTPTSDPTDPSETTDPEIPEVVQTDSGPSGDDPFALLGLGALVAAAGALVVATRRSGGAHR